MSFSSKDDLVSRASDLIQNEREGVGLKEGTIENAADSSVMWLSRWAPQVKIGTDTGDASKFQFTLPSDWIDGFSVLRWLELLESDGTARQERRYFDRVVLYPDGDAPTHYHVLGSIPETGTAANLQFAYTLPHSVGASSTVPDHQEPAFEFALACHASKMYATRKGHSTEPNIEADSVDNRTLAAEWRALADMYCKAAWEALGLDVDENGSPKAAAASRMHEWDPGPSHVWRSRSQR